MRHIKMFITTVEWIEHIPRSHNKNLCCVKQNATLRIIRHREIHIKMLSGMVEPTGDPTTLKKEERAMRPTPEVVRKWSSKLNQDNTMYECVFNGRFWSK